jgi:alanine dehydrogenase
VIVGVPCEVKVDEYRVAMTPAGVRELTSAGQRVLVERGAGAGSSISDAEYEAVGATIVGSAQELWAESEMVCKVKEPIEQEYGLLRKDQLLFTYLHLAASRACTDALLDAGTTSIAYETVQLPDRSLPLLAPMSEVAGRMAPLAGAHHLMRSGGGRGVLICGVPGVRAANVVVLGAGVAGMAAATMAVGMHASVFILDRNLERLRQVDHFCTCHRRDLPNGRHRDRCGARRRGEGPEARTRLSCGGDAEGLRPRRHIRRPGGLFRVDPADYAF